MLRTFIETIHEYPEIIVKKKSPGCLKGEFRALGRKKVNFCITWDQECVFLHSEEEAPNIVQILSKYFNTSFVKVGNRGIFRATWLYAWHKENDKHIKFINVIKQTIATQKIPYLGYFNPIVVSPAA